MFALLYHGRCYCICAFGCTALKALVWSLVAAGFVLQWQRFPDLLLVHSWWSACCQEGDSATC